MSKKDIYSKKNYEAGHVISEKNGGIIELKNLRPICNKSMHSTNMDHYIREYNYRSKLLNERIPNYHYNKSFQRKAIIDQSNKDVIDKDVINIEHLVLYKFFDECFSKKDLIFTNIGLT